MRSLGEGVRGPDDRPALPPAAPARKGATSGRGRRPRAAAGRVSSDRGPTSPSYLPRNPTINHNLPPRSREVISSAFRGEKVPEGRMRADPASAADAQPNREALL